MSLIRRVAAALDRFAPLSLADTSWDNVGLLLEPPYPREGADRVLLTIDLTPAVLDEALADPKIGAVVAYHPPIFRPWKQLTLANTKQAIVLKCAACGIGIYSPHTALDACRQGVNDWLSEGLGSDGTVRPIRPAVDPPSGQQNAGAGRIFTYNNPVSMSTLIKRIKKHLDLSHIRVATAQRHQGQNSKPISTVGICAGSGASLLSSLQTDVYFTGEMSHHEVLAALAQETSVVLCEHSNTERGYLKHTLRSTLENLLREDRNETLIDVVVSESDAEPLQVV